MPHVIRLKRRRNLIDRCPDAVLIASLAIVVVAFIGVLFLLLDQSAVRYAG